MDPDEALRELRELVAEYDRHAGELAPEQVDALVGGLIALDGWLEGGGFLPEAWRKAGRGL